MIDWKVGDRVAVFYDHGLRGIDTIARLTKTQIVLVNSNDRFKVANGAEIGNKNPWHSRHIAPATKNHILLLERKKLVNRLSNIVDWNTYSLETLRTVNAAIKGEEANDTSNE